MSDSFSSLFSEFKNNSLEDNLRNLLAILRRHLEMDVAFISEFVEGQRVFRLIDSGTDAAPFAAGDGDPLEHTYCNRIVNSELDQLIPNTAVNPVTCVLPITEKLGIGAYMGVPIKLTNGDLYGTFCCYKKFEDNSLNERDLSFLSFVSEIAAGLIENHLYADQASAEVKDRVSAAIADECLEIHYQPIFGLEQGRVMGFEALARFMIEPYRTPDIWFAEASSVGLGELLETTAIRRAVQVLEFLEPQVSVSVNASPAYIANGAVGRALAGADLSRVILEVTEHAPISDYSELLAALKPLRERGLRLAIDDAGAGYASFQHILELEADIIKLDISLTQDIHQQPKKYLLAKSLCAFAKAINCTVVAEGLETGQEFEALRELGVDKVQGYYIGRPVPFAEALEHQPPV